MRKFILRISLILLFLFGIGGLAILADYSHRPNVTTNDVDRPWPLPGLQLPDANSVIAIFYHPRCPCTRATIRNLERLVPRFTSTAHIVAFAFHPHDEDPSWIESETTQRLRAIPNSQIVPDVDGKFAIQYGATTSGQVLLFDESGRLRFNGGITPSRGHEGSCKGTDSLMHLVNGNRGQFVECPSYGCSITSPTEED